MSNFDPKEHAKRSLDEAKAHGQGCSITGDTTHWSSEEVKTFVDSVIDASTAYGFRINGIRANTGTCSKLGAQKDPNRGNAAVYRDVRIAHSFEIGYDAFEIDLEPKR